MTEFNRSAPATPLSAHEMSPRIPPDLEAALSVPDPDVGALEGDRKSVSRSMMELRDLGKEKDK